MENRSWAVNLVLVLVDILTLSAAVLLSALIRFLLEPILGGSVNWPQILNGMVFFVLFAILLSWANGLYPGFGLAAVHEMRKVIYVVTLASIFLGMLLFLQQRGLAYSRLVFLLSWVFSAILMMLGRFATRNRFSHFAWWGLPMVIVGSAKESQPVIEQLLKNRRLGFRPACTFDPNCNVCEPVLGVQPVNDKTALTEFVKTNDIRHVIFTDNWGSEQNRDFQWMRDVFPNMLFVLNTSPFGSLWVRTIDLHGTLVVETNYHLLNQRERFFKRILDLVLTALLLVLSLPLFLVLALLVRLGSKGPILYTQKRLGLNGETFDSYKFRTMFLNAEEKLGDLLAKDPQAAAEYQQYHKLANDPRVTPIGRFLRRYSLDELPQFINVIKGDMNLIGPRSYLPRELPDMGEHASIILKVQPGITGWWQVMGRNATSFKERLLLDEYYISNWSIWLDLYIVIKTVYVLLSGKGL
ncbi:undecaprenyl-phosphate galactose phosphotransferase WbaP [bacterium]|nr:undecaprenyl-phosphate galactose phosphotransferase WbaP [bacterium]